MKKPKQAPIKAVEFVRHIRDAHTAQLEGKSLEEQLAFYREEGCKAQAELERLAERRENVQHTAT